MNQMRSIVDPLLLYCEDTEKTDCQHNVSK